jgi:hypothetical protein
MCVSGSAEDILQRINETRTNGNPAAQCEPGCRKSSALFSGQPSAPLC